VQSIVVNAVSRLREAYGTKPDDIVAAIGPAATVRNYEIGQDVIDAFREKFPDSDRLLTPTREGHAKIDLHAANTDQLTGLGVDPERIFVSDLCTMERTDLFFSYRVEKRIYGKTGRLMSVIARRD
jgi:copper oxidase (laccase) domain-containing protein